MVPTDNCIIEYEWCIQTHAIANYPYMYNMLEIIVNVANFERIGKKEKAKVPQLNRPNNRPNKLNWSAIADTTLGASATNKSSVLNLKRRQLLLFPAFNKWTAERRVDTIQTLSIENETDITRQPVPNGCSLFRH